MATIAEARRGYSRLDAPGKAQDAAHGGGAMRKGALAGLGLAGLLLGGLPWLAARRLIYPPWVADASQDSLGIEFESGVVPERVTFMGSDGKELGAWFVPGPDFQAAPWPCVLLVHGYGGHKEQMAPYAKTLQRGGFSALMFDMSGSGLRRGEPISMGHYEHRHLLDAVRYLRTRPDVDSERLGALGVSMGAATILLAAAEDPSIRAIVSDSAYARLTDMVKPGIVAFLGKPALFFAPLIVQYAERILGIKSHDIRPELAAEKLGNRPIFLIHGDCDALTDPNSAHRLYEAATGPKELWMVPNCRHAYAPVLEEEQYGRRINEFFGKYLTA